MKKYFQKGLKFLVITLLVLVLLFLLTYFLIQIPKVQTWLVDKVTTNLSARLYTKVDIDAVNIEFFKKAVLEGIYIEDNQSDTLLFAKQLKVDVGVFSFFKKEIVINSIQLHGGKVRLKRNPLDRAFNYQFIVDHFTTPAPTTSNQTIPPQDTTNTAWSFDLKNILLEDVQLEMKDEASNGFQVMTEIGLLELNASKIDLDQKEIDLSKILLKKSKMAYTVFKKNKVIPKATNELSFPNLGWNVNVNELELTTNELRYDDQNMSRQPNVIDFGHLDFTDFSLTIDKLAIQEDNIEGQITKLSLYDHSGFRLKNLTGNILLNNQEIKATKLHLLTPKSDLTTNLSFNFQTFNDLNDFAKRVKIESDFAKSYASFRDLYQLIPAFRTIPNVRTDLSETIHLQGKITFAKDKLNLQNIITHIAEDLVLEANGSIASLSTNPNFDIIVTKASTDYAAISRLTKDIALPKGLQNWGTFLFSGEILGPLNDLRGKQLELTTSGQTQFKGDLAMKGLPDINNTLFTANIQNLTTQAEELKGFSEKRLPPILDSLGLMNFKGDFVGKIADFKMKGDFETSAGNLGTDVTMVFQKDFTTATYVGNLEMEKFDLGTILGGDFGEVSMIANMNGKGMKLDEITTNINATIPNFTYKKYNYQDLVIDGSFDKKQFQGKANIQDEHIAFDFYGNVDLNKEIPVIDMTMIVDTLNLKQLNLSESDIGFNGFVKADLEGNNLDDLVGSASLYYFTIQKDSTSYTSKQKTSLKVKLDESNNKTMRLRSKFMDVDIAGQYNFRTLPNAFLRYIDDFFPIHNIRSERAAEFNNTTTITKPSQDFEFDFRFKDIADIVQVFVPEFSETDTAFIKGKFSNKTKDFELNGVFPNLTYNNLSADTLQIIASGSSDLLATDIIATEARSGNTIYFPNAKFATNFRDDNLGYVLDIWNNKAEVTTKDTLVADTTSNLNPNQILLVGGKVFDKDKGYQMKLDSSLILNDENWEIDSENYGFFDFKQLIINELGFSKGNQNIVINSNGETPQNDFAPLDLRFSNFKLAEVSELLGLNDFYLDGIMNGAIVLKEPKNNLHYNGELVVDNFSYNGEQLGVLNLLANQAIGENIINVDVMLRGANDMSVSGNYAIQENQFDMDFDLKKVSFALIDPFVKEIIQDSKGDLSGKIKLTGTPSQPQANGLLQVKNLNTLVILSNTRYRTELFTIEVSNKAFDLGTTTLKDPQDNTAVLSGKIRHRYFQELILDLNVKTDAFQVLNTTIDNNELYYGNLFLEAVVQIKGPLELPALNVAAKTLPKSELFVQPFVQSLEVTQADYIIFSNPEFYTPDSLKFIEQNITKNNNGFTLALNLEVTNDAILNIIIDPETGDQLTSVGNANFTINVDALGDVSAVGNYTIDNGKYSMVYQQFIKRDFDILKGSNIIFTGDPLKAKFNITALYNVRTTLLDLIKNQATEAELKAAQLKQDISVSLKLDGDLEDPIVTFDIQIPENEGNAINSAVLNKLADLRQAPDELNKQVFGLLFFNSFIATDRSNTSITGAGESIALSSVSKLLSNQLNKLANKYIKGVEVNFDLESYKSGLLQENTMTQLQLNVSKQLFNDRLSVKVGTNVNVNSSGGSNNSDFSAIAGDFVLEYKINEEGNYYVRVFHKSDFNILEDANTNKTGAGIIFRKSFNSKKYKE